MQCGAVGSLHRAAVDINCAAFVGVYRIAASGRFHRRAAVNIKHAVGGIVNCTAICADVTYGAAVEADFAA